MQIYDEVKFHERILVESTNIWTIITHGNVHSLFQASSHSAGRRLRPAGQGIEMVGGFLACPFLRNKYIVYYVWI